MVVKDYLLAQSVEEVLDNFKAYPGEARVIAGGTDLMIDMKSGKEQCSYLVDISKIEELKKIECVDEEIVIGAAITHSQVNKSQIIREKAPLLSKASGVVGSLQIRNTATLVGNLVNAQPAADGAVALVALGAMAEIKDHKGTSNIAVEDLYAGVGKAHIDSTSQLVTCIKFPVLLPNQGSSFVRLSQRKALALPMLNVAIVLSLKADDSVEWARIVMSPVGPKPTRAGTAEKILEGCVVNDELISQAAKAAINDANPRNSGLRGSAAYRKEVLETLVRRALEEAVAAAKS